MCNNDVDEENILSATHTGDMYTVIHCRGALQSFNENSKHLNAREIGSMKRKMAHQIERLANGKRLGKDNVAQEGALPNGGHFSALKKLPMRGYFWCSKRLSNRYFISHYVFKDYRKLKKQDSKIVTENWTRIEEKDHER